MLPWGKEVNVVNETTNKHLTLEERIDIQRLISINRDEKGFLTKMLKDIAKEIGKDPTTISKEVKLHREFKSTPKEIHYRSGKSYCKNCQNETICKVQNICTSGCKQMCKSCPNALNNCSNFVQKTCIILNSFPYVCNGCPKTKICGYTKAYYHADRSQKEYRNNLVCTRTGLNMNTKEFNTLNTIVSQGIKLGQSVDIIVNNNKESLPVGKSSIYRYLNNDILSIDKFDTRRMVKMKPRKEKHPNSVAVKKAKIGHLYEDFTMYIMTNHILNYVEMDTIIGRIGGKVVLSLFFTDCHLQLFILMNSKHAICTVNVLNNLYEQLGEDYLKLFPLILTDNGIEFSDIDGMEIVKETGEVKSRIYFCHPMVTDEKSRCERNHELFRYIFPKGASFDNLTQEDLNKVASHINSYKRKSTDYASPIDVFCAKYGPTLLTKLGLTKIPENEINLTTQLIKN